MLPVIWLLGLSGSGKTTLGSILRLHLEGQGFDVEHTDGDVFRKRFGFHGFSYEDRMRNINAMRQYTLDCCLQGKFCIVTAITPYAPMRQVNREILPNYREVWVRCSLDELVRRDPKGLYARAQTDWKGRRLPTRRLPPSWFVTLHIRIPRQSAPKRRQIYTA